MSVVWLVMIFESDKDPLRTITNGYSAIITTVVVYLNLIAALIYRSRLRAFNLCLNSLEIGEDGSISLTRTKIENPRSSFKEINYDGLDNVIKSYESDTSKKIRHRESIDDVLEIEIESEDNSTSISKQQNGRYAAPDWQIN